MTSRSASRSVKLGLHKLFVESPRTGISGCARLHLRQHVNDSGLNDAIEASGVFSRAVRVPGPGHVQSLCKEKHWRHTAIRVRTAQRPPSWAHWTRPTQRCGKVKHCALRAAAAPEFSRPATISRAGSGRTCVSESPLNRSASPAQRIASQRLALLP